MAPNDSATTSDACSTSKSIVWKVANRIDRPQQQDYAQTASKTDTSINETVLPGWVVEIAPFSITCRLQTGQDQGVSTVHLPPSLFPHPPLIDDRITLRVARSGPIARAQVNVEQHGS